jgi:site-specific recombinase XerD
MFVTAAAALFLDHCRIAKRLSPHTLRAYEADLRDFGEFVGAKSALVAAVDRDVLRAYSRRLFERRLKESSVRRRLAVLKAFFQWLETEEVIALTPFHRLGITVRQPHRLPRALTAQEMRALLRRATFEAEHGGFDRKAMHFVVVVLFATGLRVGELASVGLGDVVAEEGLIQVRGKGNRERRVYLSGAEAKRSLAAYLKARSRIICESPCLLVTADGAPMGSQTIRRRLVFLAQRAGIDRRVTPHMLRHTAATQLVEAGVDIRFVQKLLGHASIATTQIYTQISDTSLRSTLEKANTLRRMM